MRANIACLKMLPIRMHMFAAKWCLLCCFALGRVISPAWGADLAANNLQLEFCATYIPCQISIGIMDAAASVDETNRKVRDYFNSIGRQPVRSEREYKEWLTTIKSSDRQNLVDKCTEKRGAFMLDWCEASYLLAGERSNQRPIEKKIELSDSDILRFGRDQLKVLQEDDAQLYSLLKVACKIEDGRLRESCANSMDLAKHLILREIGFNSDYRYQRVGLSFQSTAVNLFKQFFDWKEKDRMWVARLDPATDGIKSGEIRGGQLPTDEARSTKPLEIDNGFVDPFGGTSKRLESDSIEARRREFYRDQESARKFTEVVGAVAQTVINQKLQQDQLQAQQRVVLQQQMARQRQAQTSASSSEQRIYSDASPTQTITAPVSTNVDQTQILGVDATNCLINEPSRSGGQGSVLRNRCGYSVSAGWCVVGLDCTNYDYGFTSQWTIRGGDNYPISGSAGRKVVFGACTPTTTSPVAVSSSQFVCK